MANSRKSSCSNRLPFYKGGGEGLQRYIADTLLPLVPAGSSITVGLSGGVDSVVLLHLLHKFSSFHPLRLHALHVHHGISRNAGAWAEFCSSLCTHLEVPLQVERVDITPLREHGIEAAARKLRHAVFERQQTDFIAFAHHADDQAETLLLQLLRGAGVRGAAAMPFSRGGNNAPVLLRPLLNVPRSELLEYARQHALQWVEDESNRDDSYPRNFLRQRVLPQLEQRFSSYRETLSRSARHFSEASELLDELAMQDARLSFPIWAGGGCGQVLEIECLRSLTLLRAKNVLRYFLHVQGAPMPQAVQLDEMLHQLCSAREDAGVCVEFGGWQMRRYQGFAYVMPVLDEYAPGYKITW
ncbi:MAG: tRNA lysidine(34) synthetase TilS, partial [Gallionellaceae bacterium]|nr:tRNA lysidine(34) synthetase TilS [Gallionellaceae bacterium]